MINNQIVDTVSPVMTGHDHRLTCLQCRCFEIYNKTYFIFRFTWNLHVVVFFINMLTGEEMPGAARTYMRTRIHSFH